MYMSELDYFVFEVGQREKKLLCFDAYLGKVMDSTLCDNLIRPTESKQKCSMGSCPPEYVYTVTCTILLTEDM